MLQMDKSTAPDTLTEVDRLKLLIFEKDKAMLDAICAAKVSQRQIEDLQVEVRTIRTQEPHVLPPAPADERSDAAKKGSAADLAKVLQWKRAELELEKERSLQRKQAVDSAAHLAMIRKKLAKDQAAGTTKQANLSDVAKRKSAKRKIWILSVAAALAVASVSVAFVMYSRAPHAAPAAPAPTARPSAPRISNARPAISPATSSDFTQQLGRLAGTFRSFPGVDPEALLAEVNRTMSKPGAPVCAFQWKDGEPAFVFDGRENGPSLMTGLGGCATAVEQYRARLTR